MAVAVRLGRTSLPLVAFEPLQPPDAAHEVAPLLDQLRVEFPPLVTVVGVADRATVGAPAATVTVTDCAAVPPAPVQVRLNVDVTVRLLRTSAPLMLFAPTHPPLAVQLLALVDAQLSVVAPPMAIVVGVAVSVTDGGGGCVTVTFTDCVTDPPAPVHVSANAELAVSAPVEAESEVALLPLQLPEATQDVALVDDQLNVAAEPDTTDDGVADRVTVGGGGTVGGDVTLAVTDCAAVPPAPEQASAYVVVVARAPVDSVPDTVFVPLQPPDATHEEAFVDDHVRLAAAVC